MSLGFLALVGLFAVMIFACFAAALTELLRPRDPGPLPIDVARDVQDRHFARKLRRDRVARDIMPEPPRSWPVGEMVVADGDGALPPGRVASTFVAEGVAIIGEGATVLEHADGKEELILAAGSSVQGRATSASRVVLASGSSVWHAAAPTIRTTGAAGPDAGPAEAPTWDGSLDADLEWLLSGGTPLDRALRDLETAAGRELDGVEALLHVERRASPELQDLSAALRPSWLGPGRGWYLGAATARVTGDLVLPAGAGVPFNLIVEGSLAAGPGVRFHGGIRAGGNVALARGCVVDRSLSAGGAVHLGAACVLREVVHAGGDLDVGAGVVIGGATHGGVATLGAARLGAAVTVRNRLYAEHGARCDWL